MSTRDIYSGHLIGVTVTDTVLPNGVSMAVEAVRHPGAAAAVALDGTGNVLLVRQFRPVVADYLLELPAGRIEQNETPLQTITREMQEEIGYHPNELTPLATIFSAPGYSDERVSIFLAQQLVPRQQPLHEHEILSLVRMPFQDALEQLAVGGISDAKTIVGLLLAERILRQLHRDATQDRKWPGA